jgi:DNA-binding MarR family transcriptional regulator
MSKELENSDSRRKRRRPQVAAEWARGQSEERTALLAELVRVNRAYQAAVEKMDEAFCHMLGVNRTDGRCLDIIDQRPGLTAGELAQAVGLTAGAVTTVLDRLEARGFVERRRDPNDRRRVTVELTPEANRLAWEAYGPLGEMGGPLLADLPDSDLETIIGFLKGGTEINERRAEQIRPTRPGTEG